MPNLLSGSVPLKGTYGSTATFISLPTAQPYLGKTDTTTTGYTLVTGADGLLQFTSSLGGVQFGGGKIYSQTPNGDLTITSTGTGKVNLVGNVVATNLSANTGTFENITTTNLTVNGRAIFTSATSTVTFAANVIGSQDFTILKQFTSYGSVTLDPINGIVNITPTGIGTVLIRPDSTGLLDNMVVGLNNPQDGYFSDVTAYGQLNVTGNVQLNPTNGLVDISPPGGSVLINPTGGGLMDNMIIGLISPQAGYFTNLTANNVTATNLTVTNPVNINTATISNLTVTNDLYVAGNVYSQGGQPLRNVRVTVDTVPPPDPIIGDFWIDPTKGIEFQYVPNGTGTIWIQFVGF